MKRLRKMLELGFSATIISTLLLTACSGGGGGTAVGGSSITLTPVKGKFQGTCNVSVANTAGATLLNGLQTIQADGTTTVTLPAGSTGPYVITISGDTGGTCQYFNDDPAAPKMITMLPTESLNALVSSSEMTRASGVAVTALTEMAYQATSAVNNGSLRGLSDTSPEIHQGIAAAVNLAGLTGASAVTSIYNPPRVIPQSGIGAVDDVGRKLVQIANLNGSSPIQGVQFMSLTAAATAQPASATQFNNKRNLLTIVNNAPNTAFTSSVGAAGRAATSAVLNAATVSTFLNDFTSVNGLRDVNFGYVSPTMGNSPTVGTLIRATVTNAVYTVARTMRKLIAGVWTLPTAPSMYVLTTGGWANSDSNTISFTINPDGTANMTQDGFGSVNLAIVANDLTGMPFASGVKKNLQLTFASNVPNPGGLDSNGQVLLNASGVPTGANVVPMGTFSAGAVMYNLFTVASGVTSYTVPSSVAATTIPAGITSQDIYQVQVNPMQAVNAPSGAQMTTLPSMASTFCLFGNSNYVQPSVGGAFNVFQSNGSSCAPLGTPLMSVTPVSVTVNGVSMIEVPVPNGMGGTTIYVIAVINGLTYTGTKLPIGTPYPWSPGGKKIVNYPAAQQLMGALGLPMY